MHLHYSGTDRNVLCLLPLQEKYDSTLLNSRLLIFGNVEPVQHSDVAMSLSCNNSSESEKNTGQTDLTSPSILPCDTHSVPDNLDSTAVTESSCIMLSSSDVLCYHSIDESANIDEHVVDFLMSLFWVLESKRLDRSCELVDNLTLLTAPFEQRKDSTVADHDGRLLNSHIVNLCVHDMWVQ